MLIEALLLALLAGLAQWDSRMFGQNMLDRPLVTSVLVGIILGDIGQGIIIGGSLELVFMGIVNIGGATPPDVVTGGILGTAFAIGSGLDTETAIAIALPVALLAQSLGILARVINATFNHAADTYADKGDYKGIERTLWSGAILFFLFSAVPVFLGYYFGMDLVQSIVDSIPPEFLYSLNVLKGLLPALGVAILMRFLYDKSSAPYLFLGFVLSAFMGLSMMGIAIVGTIIAVIYYNTVSQQA